MELLGSSDAGGPEETEDGGIFHAHAATSSPSAAGFNFMPIGCTEIIPNCCRAQSFSAS